MDQTIAEIRMFGGNFAPVGWAFCNGQLLSISENEPLFSVIGTTYGGDGITTFAVPDLRGRAPVHQGATLTLGQQAAASAASEQPQSPPWLCVNFIIALEGVYPSQA